MVSKKGRKFPCVKEDMVKFINILIPETFWKITNIFLTPVLKARVFTFQHQVVEFKIYVMPFFSRKVNLYFSSIELVLSAYQIFIFFVIFLNIIVNIIEFVNQSDNNIKI